jgi:hypothetical protein
VFGIIERDVTDDTLLKIGRFTDKYISPTRITFKSKVVSRGHAEIWAKNGKVSEVIGREKGRVPHNQKVSFSNHWERRR